MEILTLLLSLVAIVVSIASFIYFILVLIKLFENKKVWWGIFGIICGLYTFIWGWQNAERLGMQKTMLNWTICIIIGIVLNVIFSFLGTLSS